jgi:hypothetical protein
MPTPKKGESKEDFIKRCTPIVIEEGKDEDQARAVCEAMWEKNFKPEDVIETAELKGVEIAHTGNFNKFNITDETLTDIVSNFNNDVFQAVLTINHDPKETKKLIKSSKSTNLGIISNLKKKGKKLFADITKIPKMVAQFIDSGRLIFRSIELKPLYKHANGGVFKNVLTGVTFHGGADGSSAITDLSNEFEAVGLKLFKEKIEQDNGNVSIEFKAKEKKMPDNVIELKKEEYQELIAFKTENERLKLDNEQKDKDIESFKTEVTELKSDNDKMKAKVEEVNKKEEVMLQTEAETYVDKLIEDKKKLPKFKDMLIEQFKKYRSEGEEALKLFKEDCESSKQVITGEFKADGTPKKTGEFKTEDEAEDAIQALMKAEDITWNEAAVKLKIIDAPKKGDDE